MPLVSSPPEPPLVSVLLPVHDAEATLDEALDSLEAQTLRRWELVAVDDGSEDRSVEILRRRADRDGRIRVYHMPAGGIPRALNAGLKQCRARFVARMDADDVALPERLEAQVDYLDRHPEVALVGGRVELIGARDDEPGEGMRRYVEWLNGIHTPEEVAREIFVECPIAHPAFCFRRAVVSGQGGYREEELPEDYDLVLRLHAAGRAMANLDRVLLRWRDHPGRASRVEPAYARDRFLDLKVEALAETVLARRPFLVWGAGRVGRYLSRGLIQRGIELVGFVDVDENKQGRVVRRRPVHAPDHLAGGPGSLGEPAPLVIGAVGTRGARARIRAALEGYGFTEGPDFVMAA